MIRIIKRNLTKRILEEKDWNWHLACFHFKDYKNCYINGKPLRPYHILKKGDVIEVIERPYWTLTLVGQTILNFLGTVGSLASGGLHCSS